MRKKLIVPLIIFLFVLANCSIPGIKRPETEQEVTIGRLSYKIVHAENDFKIREAYLGTWKEQDWDHFSMPEARIQNGNSNLGLDDVSDEKYLEWKKQWETTGWCTDTIKIITTNGTENKFTITKNHLGLGGHYLLKKNGILIWEKDLRAITLGPIISSKQIGDEIAIDYLNTG
jgi:hypothetical protein